MHINNKLCQFGAACMCVYSQFVEICEQQKLFETIDFDWISFVIWGGKKKSLNSLPEMKCFQRKCLSNSFLRMCPGHTVHTV